MPTPFRVLIIDDSEMHTRMIVHALRKQWPALVFERVDTEDAMHGALSEQTWDCILCDVVMPAFSAPMALKLFKQSELILPFIIISSIAKIENVVDLLKTGAHDFVPKDNLARLVPSIESAMRDAENQRSRIQAEEALRQSETHKRTLLDTLPDIVWLKDSKGVYLCCNARYERFIGHKESEILGKSNYDLVDKALADFYFEQDQAVMAAGNSIQYEDEGTFANDGHTELLERTKVPMFDADGTVVGILGVAHDVTERKQRDEELARHRHHLEELVEERTLQLAEARQRAEAASEAKGAFLANMSHEIRTPMNAIVGLTDMLQHSDVTREQSQQLNKIESSAEHLLSIINNILDLSKIEAGKLTLEEVDFHLEAFLDQIQSMFSEQLRVKDLIIESNLGDVPVWLRGDLTRLRQAWFNYVSNAIKFSEKGTIVLRANKLEEVNDEILIRFEVQDPGIGIEPDKLARLFTAFEQADVSTTREYGGTGLGLIITRRLAQLMGGDAGAQSIPGQGSTFWFSARLGHGQGEMPGIATSREMNDGLKLTAQQRDSRILLAEDNAINSEVAVSLLSREGLAVDTAENGREAVEKFCATAYDLILMDVQMPEMDGLEATRTIRSMEGSCASHKDLPILALTANVFAGDRRACLDAGMNDFVAKPIDVKSLFATLAKWLPGQEPDNPVEASPD